ncbi:MAG: hypothetical protein FJ399_21740 [Verrucomicrobia bacterium]|nr:hypothetical protein [Verrucomicrobiota bacterium]
MTTPATPSPQHPAGDDRNLVPADASTAASFEEKMQSLWAKYRNPLGWLCTVVVLGILAHGAWNYFAQQKELEIRQAFAAATTPEQLKVFAAGHTGHALGGVAQLQIADDAYKAGKAAEAIAGYEKALALIKDGPLAARAKMGRALARVPAGKVAEATAELKQLADDAAQFKAARTEAAYHLTSLAVEAGNAAEAQKYVDQLMQLDVSSPWTQRAMAVRASLPATPAPSPAAADAKKEEPATAVQVKLPGK